MIDLHVHSNKSDGSYAPKDLIPLAKEAGVTAFALTDHDTVAGVKEAVDAAEGSGVRVLTGVEISAGCFGREVHLVGLCIDPDSDALTGALSDYMWRREQRNEQMIRKMQADGFDVTSDLLRELYPGAVITRAHFARYLVKKGAVCSVSEAFDRYVGEGCRYYVKKELMPFETAVSLIEQTGGLSVLAHPFRYSFDEETLEKVLSFGKDAGLSGIEVYYSTHTANEEAKAKELAEKYDLFMSGGSDFHGENKPDIRIGTGRGSLCIGEETLKELEKRCKNLSDASKKA